MAIRFDPATLKTISEPPLANRQDWLSRAEDSVGYLVENARSDEIIIYASANAVFVHAVLAPQSQVTPPNQDDLGRCFIQIDDAWRIQRSYGGGHPHRVYLEPPLSSPGCNSLVGGEKLIYRRSFAGVRRDPYQMEISQKLVHSFDLHFVRERNAYCRLDGRGDIEDVVRVIPLDDADGEAGIVVTILAADLWTYMTLTNTTLVSKFDFTRFVPGSFASWNGAARSEYSEQDLFYDTGVVAGHASYVNGCLLTRTPKTVDGLIQEWMDELDPKKREYATFKIFDRKNNRMVETSCAPEYLSNYFQKSDLPWEISPAFFRADVLHRFKADPEKYTLEDRSISCRGAWHLKTCDINEAGQVHTYIGYLAHLPIEEQRYWQAFNEWPKGSISKRAFETDILGEFSSEPDPLNSIKYKIQTLDNAPPAWWKPRGSELADAARYPSTDSTLEWANEILALDQLLVEGFLVKPLRQIAEKLGRTLDPSWGSLKLLTECLIGLDRTEEQARNLVSPLRELHALRTPLRGHGAVSDRREAESGARSTYGTLRAHFSALTLRCDNAFEEILSALRNQ